MMSETDNRLYYDVDMANIKTGEELLQAIKLLQNIHTDFFDLYLNHLGIDTGNKVTRITKKPDLNEN